MATGWSDPHRQILYREARAVLDAQRDTMGDIEDKALRVVRINAVVIGLLLAVVQFDPDIVHGSVTSAGIVLLAGSSLLAIATVDRGYRRHRYEHWVLIRSHLQYHAWTKWI